MGDDIALFFCLMSAPLTRRARRFGPPSHALALSRAVRIPSKTSSMHTYTHHSLCCAVRRKQRPANGRWGVVGGCRRVFGEAEEGGPQNKSTHAPQPHPHNPLPRILRANFYCLSERESRSQSVLRERAARERGEIACPKMTSPAAEEAPSGGRLALEIAEWTENELMYKFKVELCTKEVSQELCRARYARALKWNRIGPPRPAWASNASILGYLLLRLWFGARMGQHARLCS